MARRCSRWNLNGLGPDAMSKIVILGCGFVGVRAARRTASASGVGCHWRDAFFGLNYPAGRRAIPYASLRYRRICLAIPLQQNFHRSRCRYQCRKLGSRWRGGISRDLFARDPKRSSDSQSKVPVIRQQHLCLWAMRWLMGHRGKALRSLASPTSRILREAEAVASRHTAASSHGSRGSTVPGVLSCCENSLPAPQLSKATGSGTSIKSTRMMPPPRCSTLSSRNDLPAGIYNVADNHAAHSTAPATSGSPRVSAAIRCRHAAPLPPSCANAGVTDKRVSNAKLRSLGWSLIYPSFPEAVMRDAELLAAARAGETGGAPT